MMKNKENLIKERVMNYIKKGIEGYGAYYKLEGLISNIEKNINISYENIASIVIKCIEDEIEAIDKEIVEEIGEENAKKLLYLIVEENAKADNEILHKYYILGQVKKSKKYHNSVALGNTGSYYQPYDVVKHYYVKELCEKRINYQSKINYLNYQINVKINNNSKPKRP
jgi:hypothetical protein